MQLDAGSIGEGGNVWGGYSAAYRTAYSIPYQTIFLLYLLLAGWYIVKLCHNGVAVVEKKKICKVP